MKKIGILIIVPFLFGAGVCAQVEAPESVRPGINKNYLEEDLKVDDWKKRFEVESREVFSERAEVMKACGLKPGMKVADVGAGTGLYTRLFGKAVGEKGWVYAVDIAPGFLEYINESSKEIGLENVTAVICPHDSVALPPESTSATFCPRTSIFPERIAVRAAAPPGSITSFKVLTA